MHAQIRNVISRLHWFGNRQVMVELSASEQSPLGRLLSRLYYDTNVMSCLGEGRNGYPHNGGMHTFTYRGAPRDVVACLELFKETLENFKLTPEESQVAHELSYISQEILSRR